ncbi:MAG: DUF2029 domain-containing protein [Myxococcales bacterium]|nr:DUF2029 domain-containing protein [Myxococcales bacterium]
MHDDWTRSSERSAFGALVAVLLAPVVAHGVWRPLVHALGPSGDAGSITAAAVAIAAAVALVRRVRSARALHLAFGSGVTIAAGASLGLDLGLAGLLTLTLVAAAATTLAERLFPRIPASLDGLARRHRALTALYGLVALTSVLSVARVSVFMGDPTRVDQQVLPGEAFLETHSCLTAYVHADTLARGRVDNLYAPRWWLGAHGYPPRPAGAADPYHPFQLDYYAYPPPFLLAVAPLAPLGGDFLAQRALWFGLNGLLLAVGLWILARWIDGPNTHRVLLLSPVFFASLPVLATLQIGNFQIAVVVLSVLAMIAFHARREPAGGALLACAILSKISPGVLGVVLLAQRRWRSAAWSAGFGALFLGLSALILGGEPIASFAAYTLPRLGSGEAFAFLDDQHFNILTNMSPFGLPFKLQLLGLDIGDPWTLARQIGRGYSLALVVLAILAAVRRPGDRRGQAVTWMSLLLLAALQSPFAPGYTLIALLWALTLVAAEVDTLRGGVGLALLWLALAVVVPWPDVALFAAHSIAQATLAVVVPVWLIFRGARSPAAPRPEDPGRHSGKSQQDPDALPTRT